MDIKEAIAALARGYGDDCPDGDDQEALWILWCAGLHDGSPLSSHWPRWGEFVARDPDTGECILVSRLARGATMENFTAVMKAFYLTPMVAQLNQSSYLIHHVANEEFRREHPDRTP